jgi:hypothetical protein
MEDRSRARLAEQFPDVVDDLAAVAPDTGILLRVEDAWIAARYADGSRLRVIDLAAPARHTTVAALLTDAGHRARSEGWRMIERDDDTPRNVYRRTDKRADRSEHRYLRVWPDQVDFPTAIVEVARIDLEVHCPWAHMARVVTDRMIHQLARARWGLEHPARSLRLEVLYDPDDPTEPSVLREHVELVGAADALRPRLRQLGLEPLGGARNRWARVERFTKGELTTAVALDDELAIVALELNRAKRLR